MGVAIMYNKYKQTINHQGSIAGGITVLIIGAACFIAAIFYGIYLLNASNSYSQDYGPYYSNPGRTYTSGGLLIFAIIVGLVCVPFGIYMLVNGIRGRKVRMCGKLTYCTIRNIETHWRRHGGRYYHMEAFYKGESGETHSVSLSVNYWRVGQLVDGMKVVCYVYGENCYVDIDRIEEYHPERKQDEYDY